MSQFPYRDEKPAWIDARVEGTDVRVREFFRSVYTWMFGGLALTALTALAVLQSPALQNLFLRNRIMWIGMLVVELGLVMYLQLRITKMSAATAAIAFLLYSALNGLTLSVIFFVYTAGAIYQAFFSAAAMFAAMSIYGYVTKKDLTSWGSFLIMGAWGLFFGFLINMFLKSGPLGYIMSAIGVVIFLGLTAYDTQKLKSFAASPHAGNLAIVGALWLYLDFINLFLMLLRLFGGRRD